MRGLRLTAKERILLHLLEFTKYADSVEVPPGMTREGVAQAAWILVPHVTQYVRPLIREELARERTAHVLGGRRKRKVYDLTDPGRREAIRLRTALKAEPVRVRDSQGLREETVADVLQSVRGGVSILDLARRAVQSGGVVAGAANPKKGGIATVDTAVDHTSPMGASDRRAAIERTAKANARNRRLIRFQPFVLTCCESCACRARNAARFIRPPYSSRR